MSITEGAVFSEELKNSSSLRFKSLAYDVQQQVTVIVKDSKEKTVSVDHCMHV